MRDSFGSLTYGEQNSSLGLQLFSTTDVPCLSPRFKYQSYRATNWSVFIESIFDSYGYHSGYVHQPSRYVGYRSSAYNGRFSPCSFQDLFFLHLGHIVLRSIQKSVVVVRANCVRLDYFVCAESMCVGIDPATSANRVFSRLPNAQKYYADRFLRLLIQ